MKCFNKFQVSLEKYMCTWVKTLSSKYKQVLFRFVVVSCNQQQRTAFKMSNKNLHIIVEDQNITENVKLVFWDKVVSK